MLDQHDAREGPEVAVKDECRLEMHEEERGQSPKSREYAAGSMTSTQIGSCR